MPAKAKIFFSDADKLKATKVPKNAKIAKPIPNQTPRGRGPPKNRNNKPILVAQNQNLRKQQPKQVAVRKPNPVQNKPIIVKAPPSYVTAPVNKQMPTHKVLSGSQSHTNTTGIAVTIQTAEAIANDASHPNNAEVSDLLRTYHRGWMPEQNFREILRSLVL
mmetsp:Transcript_25885/g.26099  ORF Transcript_25885/g.26099 Transcript_25885/m.26099 type:complete len:162 (+) Transcript_25885:98-583(+)